MKVSIITPTYLRPEACHRNLYECFKSQTYPEKELLIFDDSPSSSPFFEGLPDRTVIYLYSSQKLTIGEKRNQLIQLAKGDVIVHFDDDDYYAPNYVEKALEALGDRDFVTLDGWFAYAQKQRGFFYWDTREVGNCHYKVSPGDDLEVIYTELIPDEEKQIWAEATQWGFGFSYLYRKSIFETFSFEETDFGEDYKLVQQIRQAGCQLATWRDEQGLVLHVIHELNISLIFPQFILPNFLIQTLFGDPVIPYLQAMRERGEE
jgi:glycosyltransferase involved in cell wall biosynthesis